MSRARLRRRSPAEQMYWDSLTPAERVAFTVGYHLGQGGDFPRPSSIDEIRLSVGACAPCIECGGPMPQRAPGAKGRPPTKCPRCRIGAGGGLGR